MVKKQLIENTKYCLLNMENNVLFHFYIISNYNISFETLILSQTNKRIINYLY